MRRFGGQYVERVVDRTLDEMLGQLPALLLDGPRGVGKTTTAMQRAQRVIRLDDAAERAVVEADPSRVAAGPYPVLIDEWQRVPEVWDVVRRAVDDDYSAGRFLLTGSEPGIETHSGAGRIATLRMRPLTLPERGVSTALVSLADLVEGGTPSGLAEMGLDEYVAAMLQSGFPGLQELSGTGLRSQLDSYVDRIVEHDMAQFGHAIRRPATVRSWLAAYAAASASPTSWDKIRDAATPGDDSKPAKRTLIGYRDALTALRILDDVEAWIPSHNHLRRLTHAPKHHLADAALAARLTRVTATTLLEGASPSGWIVRDGTFLGALFETMVVQSVRVFSQPLGARVYHLRTQDTRHEVDAIIELPEGGIVAVETKLARTITDDDTKHLIWLRDKIRDDLVAAIVVHTGPEAYTRRDGVHVVPLALLGP